MNKKELAVDKICNELLAEKRCPTCVVFNHTQKHCVAEPKQKLWYLY